MRILLVRHGMTDDNRAGIVQGHRLTTLNEEGRHQVKRLAKRLQSEKIDAAYVSDLPRAQETAQEILTYHPSIPVVYTKELRERSYGTFEGKHGRELMEERRKSGVAFEKYTPTGGESLVQVQRRVVKMYKQIIKKHHHQTVLMVSHGAIIRALLLWLEQQPWSLESYEKYHPANCALTRIDVDDTQQHRITLLNCVQHLG